LEKFEVEILLVEDNPDDVELIMRSLKKHNLGNNVQIINDGAEALEYIFAAGRYADRDMNSHPRVILLDLMLPKVNGIEILRRVRNDERTKRIPVVVLTSSDEDRDMMDSYNLGVNSFITKPLEFNAFMKVIAELGFYWVILNKTSHK
jgi:two-component system response regulator